MKQEEFMESIYGCLERIENKINGLSMPQSAGGDAEADKEVIQELVLILVVRLLFAFQYRQGFHELVRHGVSFQ